MTPTEYRDRLQTLVKMQTALFNDQASTVEEREKIYQKIQKLQGEKPQ